MEMAGCLLAIEPVGETTLQRMPTESRVVWDPRNTLLEVLG